VDRKKIPEGVWMQVLTQCREELIDRTFEAIEGIENVIFHIYNSTSVLQRDVVFHKNKEEIIKIAVDATHMVKERAKNFPGKIMLEYSPESFTGTEMEFALEICTAVQEAWGATKDNPIIFNLPATVEMNTPNVYADQIEWMNKHFKDRESIILSVHPHNDRGTGVAATELVLLAGADRVEGTLFGNGERTGNVDILNIAYNMFSQGIDPKLELEQIKEIIDVYERCCKMTIDERHPYAGKLVFTAFSGSHQDAINKGVHAMKERGQEIWQVPYLPIDPADIGREYEPIVRINSQSGKGGVAYIMDTYFGFKLPKGMHKEFAKVIQEKSEKQGEVSPEEIMQAFKDSYIDRKEPLHFRKLHVNDLNDTVDSAFDTKVDLTYTLNGVENQFEAVGNGPIDAILRGLRESLDLNVKVLDYEEHALQGGANAQAAAYIHLLAADDGQVTYGVGVSSNITRASARAIFSAINRLELIK
jgi:2-isopropylmalate synthase